MGLFLKYLLISVLIFGLGFAGLFVLPESLMTLVVALVLLGNSVSWIMYGVRKYKRKP